MFEVLISDLFCEVDSTVHPIGPDDVDVFRRHRCAKGVPARLQAARGGRRGATQRGFAVLSKPGSSGERAADRQWPCELYERTPLNEGLPVNKVKGTH